MTRLTLEKGRAWRALGLLAIAVWCTACATDDLEDNGGNNSEIRDGIDFSGPIAPTDDMNMGMTSGGEDAGVDMPTPSDMPPGEEMGVDMRVDEEDMRMDEEDMRMDEEDMRMDEEDMAEDMRPPAMTCAQQASINTTYTLDGNGLAGQYYVRSVFDGVGVWTTYVKRASMSNANGDVWATRTACDGSVLVPPFKVSTSAGGNSESYPNIAARNNTVFIVWTEEEDTSGDEHVYMRSFDATGTANQTAAIDITPQVNGQPISTLIWETDVAALPNGEAVMVASFSSQKALAFQVVAQRFDAMGNLVGPAIAPLEEKGINQTRPSVTALETGEIYVSWTREDPMGMAPNPRVVYTRIAPGATEPDQSGPFPARPGSQDDNQLSRYAKEATTTGEVFLAFQIDSSGANDIFVKDGTFNAPVNQSTTIAQGSRIDLRPSVAARTDGTGGVVTWMRADPSPISNEVVYRAFDAQGGTFTTSPEVTVSTSDPAKVPYGPSITYVGDGAYFLSWTEGPSTPAARIHGRFIQP